MDKKRRRTEKQVDFYDNPSDSQLDEGSNDSSDSEFSENSMDSDYEVVSETEDNNDVSEASTSSTGDNLWTEIPQNPELFVFQENVGFKLDTTNLTVQTLVDLFFSEEFLALLVEQTNLYAKQEIANLKKIKKSNRASQWIDVTVSEMKVFIALLLQMGPCTFPSIEHYWSRNKLYNVMFWRSHMSRNRFQLLLRYFHLVDNSVPSSDRLYKVRPILNHFNDIMSQNYVPNKNICIDESMLLWRGRLYFRQYIKNKKHKYGIKLYELCES